MNLRSTLVVCVIGLLGLFSPSSGCSQTGTTSHIQRPSSRIAISVDASNNRTTVRLKPVTITRPEQEKQLAANFPLHQMELEVFFTYVEGARERPIETVTLRFRCLSSTYIFLKGQQVIAALDRETPGKDRGFVLGMTGYRSESPKFNSVYEEIFDIEIPADGIAKLARAKTLELFVGPIGYRLTNKHLDGIREFHSLARSIGPRPPKAKLDGTP